MLAYCVHLPAAAVYPRHDSGGGARLVPEAQQLQLTRVEDSLCRWQWAGCLSLCRVLVGSYCTLVPTLSSQRTRSPPPCTLALSWATAQLAVSQLRAPQSDVLPPCCHR